MAPRSAARSRGGKTPGTSKKQYRQVKGVRYDDGARSLGKYCQPNELYLADRRARSCLEFVRMRLEFRNATAMLCGCGGSHDADPATV